MCGLDGKFFGKINIRKEWLRRFCKILEVRSLFLVGYSSANGNLWKLSVVFEYNMLYVYIYIYICSGKLYSHVTANFKPAITYVHLSI